MKYVIYGSGQLANEFKNQLPDAFVLPSTYRIDNPAQIEEELSGVYFDTFLNCVGYTNVDKCEEDFHEAHTVNAWAIEPLLEICRKRGAKFVHFSTDYVFDGKNPVPYKEKDSTIPLNMYGRTKLEGEKLIQKVYENYLIIRTQWLYGGENSFVKTILKLATEKEEMNIVSDQIGCPTWTKYLVNATTTLCEAKSQGIYHYSSEGHCSWYDFAQKIVACAAKQMPLKVKKINAVTSKEYPLPAKRPKWGVLSKEKLLKEQLIPTPSWDEMVVEYLLG